MSPGARSAPRRSAAIDSCCEDPSNRKTSLADTLPALALRVCGEFREMPGMRLTVMQAARLFGLEPELAQALLDELHRASLLTRSSRGSYSLPG